MDLREFNGDRDIARLIAAAGESSLGGRKPSEIRLVGGEKLWRSLNPEDGQFLVYDVLQRQLGSRENLARTPCEA